MIFREWKNAWFDATYQKLDLDSNQSVSILDATNLDLNNLQLSGDGKKALYYSSPKANKKEENRKFTNKLVFFDGSKIGETILTLPEESTSWVYRFAPNVKSIYYTNIANMSDVWQFDFATQKSTKVTNFNLDSIYNFTVSRDGKKLYIVRGNTTDEVVLIKNVE